VLSVSERCGVNVTFWGLVRDKTGERHGFNDFAEERNVHAVNGRR